MIGTSSLSGDTLIACHFPVVQLPTWQLPVQALCGSAKRPGRLCSVGLTRAVSLPEQESLSREHAFGGGRRHFSSSYSSLNEDRAEEEGASDSSGRYDSTSSPEETGPHPRKEALSGARGGLRARNSFLPDAEVDEDEEDEDSDGDNLHRYHEDSSFVLHGNSNWPWRHGARHHAAPRGDVDSGWGSEGTALGPESGREWLCNQPNGPGAPHAGCQCLHASRSGVAAATACGEQDSDRSKDNNASCCCIRSQRECSPELPSNGGRATDYVSDSSCNSSDGVLVNFCAIYDRSNNPATPHDLSSPAAHPSGPREGSVFLNLQPVPQAAAGGLQQDAAAATSPPKEEADVTPPAPRWSPRGLDSNCNLYSLEPLPPGLSSLEASDLTACLQSQATLVMGTNQKYYKLVTCDLSSQSPSPAWSSLTGCPEGQSRGSPPPPSEQLFVQHKKEGQHKDVKKETEEKKLCSAQCSATFDCSQFQTCEDQAATTSTDRALCRKTHADGIQHLSHSPCSLCHSQRSPHTSKCQDTRAVSTQPSVVLDQEHCNTDATEKGACSLENAVVRYSKAQRPTSLPIQPFVLIPAGKPQSQAQHLGCLLEQYINQKSSKSSGSQLGFKGKGKSGQHLSNLQPSPMGGRCPIFLEAPSSSDTCSTCTPSPECFGRRHTWSQASRGQGRPSPSKSGLAPSHTSPKPKPVQVQDKTSPRSGMTHTNSFFNLVSAPNQPNLVKIPTYQDLINLTPEQSHANVEPESPHQSQSRASYHSIFSHTPPTLPLTTDTHQPNLQASLSPPAVSQPEKKNPQHRAAPAADSGFFHGSFTAALSSVAPLSSLSSLLSLAASGLHQQQIQDSAGPSGKHSQSQHSESLILSDRPPTEFCLSPDTSYESLSISHLQRRGLLRSVSRAVDLIMAHFGSSRDPEEKMRLGNSSWSPTIAGLVLEHLCPTIQNILEDGLRDHKLDIIIGQRRNHSWTVVEVSTRIGPSTRVLHSLVSKIRQCPQLTSHCMRLRAFIMGLLNLRALEFWLSHLQSQKDVVTTYYHSWGFLSTSLSRCQPLFQELLLLLQPLSVLPFDLNLLLEPRLLRNRQLCAEEQGVSPPPPCSALLVTSWPRLQADRKVDGGRGSQQTKLSHPIGLHYQESLSPLNSSCIKQQCGGMQVNRSPLLAPIPEWWPGEPDLMDGVVEGEDCSQNYTDTWSQISMDSRQDEERRDTDSGTPNVSACVQEESPSQGGLRWAKLFGAADTSTRVEAVSQSHTGAQTKRRPSQWLHLDRSQLGLLARSIRSMKLVRAQTDKNKDY